MKTTRLRTRRLEIAASLYSLSKGLRAIYYSEKSLGVGLEEWGVVAK